ncbi:cation transporter [Haladaptatus sp. SPP-AMP-3]|uniref:cation transporter n=1 Tax=Haladaptatus sp. SPP-AMP-3 TaxID=3121295 RepID=UPI003C2ED2C0
MIRCSIGNITKNIGRRSKYERGDVETVTVDNEADLVRVKGSANVNTIAQAIEDAGYIVLVLYYLSCPHARFSNSDR